MEKVTTVGIDLAKSVFSLHGVDAKAVVQAHGAPSGPERTIAHQQAGYSDEVRPSHFNLVPEKSL